MSEREGWESAVKDPKWIADRDSLAPSSPQPAEDLERALAEMSDLFAAAVEDTGHTEHRVYSQQRFQIMCWRHWPTIRAALDRERELRELDEEIARLRRTLVDVIVMHDLDQMEPDAESRLERAARTLGAEALPIREGSWSAFASGGEIGGDIKTVGWIVRAEDLDDLNGALVALPAQPVAGEERERAEDV